MCVIGDTIPISDFFGPKSRGENRNSEMGIVSLVYWLIRMETPPLPLPKRGLTTLLKIEPKE